MDTDGVSKGAEPRDGVLGRWKVYVPDVDGPVVRGPVAEVVEPHVEAVECRAWRGRTTSRNGRGMAEPLGAKEEPLLGEGDEGSRR